MHATLARYNNVPRYANFFYESNVAEGANDSGPEVEGNMIVRLFDASVVIYHITGRNINKI
jgi:hypothetical protein